jgi:tetratricopeptide (TPR) repeat protein
MSRLPTGAAMAAALLSACVVATPSWGIPQVGNVAIVEAAPESILTQFSALSDAVDVEDYVAVSRIARTIIDHPDLVSYPEEVQSGVRILLGLSLVVEENYRAALPLLRPAIDHPAASLEVWVLLIAAELGAEDYEAAARWMIRGLDLYPQIPDQIGIETTSALLWDTRLSADTRFDVTAALLRANWDDPQAGIVWLTHVSALLDRGAVLEATALAPRITGGDATARLLAERRFDALRDTLAEPLDLNRAYEPSSTPLLHALRQRTRA